MCVWNVVCVCVCVCGVVWCGVCVVCVCVSFMSLSRQTPGHYVDIQ